MSSSAVPPALDRSFIPRLRRWQDRLVGRAAVSFTGRSPRGISAISASATPIKAAGRISATEPSRGGFLAFLTFLSVMFRRGADRGRDNRLRARTIGQANGPRDAWAPYMRLIAIVKFYFDISPVILRIYWAPVATHIAPPPNFCAPYCAETRSRAGGEWGGWRLAGIVRQHTCIPGPAGGLLQQPLACSSRRRLPRPCIMTASWKLFPVLAHPRCHELLAFPRGRHHEQRGVDCMGWKSPRRRTQASRGWSNGGRVG